MFNFVDVGILEHSGESTVHHSIFLGRLSLLGRPGHPKVVSIKNLRSFALFRDHFGLPDRNFSIQAIAVVLVFSVFFDRPRSSLGCFHIIVQVASTQFEKTGATGTTRTTIWKLGLKTTAEKWPGGCIPTCIDYIL